MALKILTVADFIYPETVGGSAIMAYEISKELAARGHELCVLTRSASGESFENHHRTWPVVTYELPDSETLYPLGVVRAIMAVRRLTSSRAYDLVLIHHACTGIAVELWRKTAGFVPTVFFFHGPWHKEAIAKEGMVSAGGAPGCDWSWKSEKTSIRHRVRREIDRFILKNCDAVVVLSDYITNEARSLHSELDDKICKITGGVDLDRYTPTDDRSAIRRELGLPKCQVVLLTIRRLTPRMGLENLVRAMVFVEKERADVMLIIGGEGPMKNRLAELISELNLKRTHLVGYISEGQKAQYYQASDLFIMPSLTLEGFGLSTIEAMACGVPVLALCSFCISIIR